MGSRPLPQNSQIPKFPFLEKSYLPSPPLHADNYYEHTMAAPRPWDSKDLEGSREAEDATLHRDYSKHEATINSGMSTLVNRRQQLERELQMVNRSLAEHENERTILARSYHDNKNRLAAQRQSEDHNRAERLRQSQDPRPGQIMPRDDRRPTPGPPIVLPPITNPRGWTTVNQAPPAAASHPRESGPPTNSVYYHPGEVARNGNQSVPFRSASRPNGAITDLLSRPEDDAAYAQRRNGERLLMPRDPHSLPSFNDVIHSTSTDISPPTEISDREMGARPGKSRKSLPNGKGNPKKDEVNTNDGREITRDNLVVTCSETAVIGPAMYEGCPLERIDEKHPYWDPEWESLEEIIRPQLDKWKEKLETLRNTPNAVRHTIFLANRQVNRGQSIMSHLEDKTAFHPYQFVGKEMMSRFYKTLTNYDTMFRLCNVYDELKKFDLEVTPLQWLRQRMFEISMAWGDKFSLSKTTHDLYHDPKLKTLREKHGFGNIGRPSGYKLSERAAKKRSSSKVREVKSPAMTVSSIDADTSPEFSRRSTRRSFGQVEPDDSPVLPPIAQPYGRTSMYSNGSATPPMQKRQRVDPAPEPQPEREDEFGYEGYTSTDSFSGGQIAHLDFRVDQIKTRAATTSPEVTQYWSWKPDQIMFEHQVLRDVSPRVTWGYYDKPNSFNIHLSELVEIQYSPNCDKILAILNDGDKGEVLAQFKRDRTRRRFLDFARKKEAKLARVTSDWLEQAWESTKSETRSDAESNR